MSYFHFPNKYLNLHKTFHNSTSCTRVQYPRWETTQYPIISECEKNVGYYKKAILSLDGVIKDSYTACQDYCKEKQKAYFGFFVTAATFHEKDFEAGTCFCKGQHNTKVDIGGHIAGSVDCVLTGKSKPR